METSFAGTSGGRSPTTKKDANQGGQARSNNNRALYRRTMVNEVPREPNE